jgi:hypothetical protein
MISYTSPVLCCTSKASGQVALMKPIRAPPIWVNHVKSCVVLQRIKAVAVFISLKPVMLPPG